MCSFTCFIFHLRLQISNFLQNTLSLKIAQTLGQLTIDTGRVKENAICIFQVNFLDLLDVLIRAPESTKRLEKLEDINLLFINMHHLINEFRPHQARETLRVMMEIQRKQRGQVSQKFQEHYDKVSDIL